jgi:hypothetical protein
MEGPFVPYIVYKPKGDGIEWPEFTTTSGKTAVAVFTNPERARQFIKDRLPGDGWHIGTMEQPEFLRWLRDNLESGRPLLLVDGQAEQGACLEILGILADAEGWHTGMMGQPANRHEPRRGRPPKGRQPGPQKAPRPRRRPRKGR